MKKIVASLISLVLFLNVFYVVSAQETNNDNQSSSSNSENSTVATSETPLSDTESSSAASAPTDGVPLSEAEFIEPSSAETSPISENSTDELQTPQTYAIYSGFMYTLSNKEIEITNYLGTDTDVVIPSYINNYPVTSLDSDIFSENTSIESVTFPSELKTIPSYIFWNFDSLETVIFPTALTTIDDGAFFGCTALKTLTLPNTVTTIGAQVFKNCTNLSQIILPTSLTSIGNSAFSGCKKLTTVNLPSSVTSIGTNIFENCTTLSTVQLSPLLTAIPNNAFKNCSALTSVTLPNSITSIGNYAFTGCSLLSEVNLSKNLTTLKIGAFQNCTSLTSIILPASITTTSQPFQGCSALNSIVLDEGMQTLPSNLFSYCNGPLSEITFPTTLTTIGSYAFSNCENFSAITIPQSITTIEEYAFSNNPLLAAITIPRTTTTLNDNIFASSSNINIHCYKDSSTYSYAVQNNLKYTLISDPGEEPVDPTEAFIYRVYKYSLNRIPSEQETLYWTQQLKDGKTGGKNFVATMFLSDEFIIQGHSNENFIILLYNAVLGRTPDSGGLSHWGSKLKYSTSRASILNEFLSTAEFPAFCESNGFSAGIIGKATVQDANLRTFVARVHFEILGRTPSLNDMSYWSNKLRTKEITAYNFMYSFAFGQEVTNKNLSNGEFVKMLYRGMMNREYDQSGYNFYVSRLNNGTLTRAEIFSGLYYSDESKALLATLGLS